MATAIASMHSPISHRPQKKQKMSITQTYFLAHTARGKLAKAASRADHDLRLLVGHANLLDELMIDLANAEQEQENWFNQTVSGAKAAEEEQKPAKQTKHIQWADTVIEEPEEDWQAEDADSSDSEDEDVDVPMTATTISLVKPDIAATTITTRELTEEYDEDEASEELALTRTQSHHPPELASDSDDDSEDEPMPPSPPSTTLEFTEKERQAIATTSFYDKIAAEHQLSESEQSHFLEEGFFLPSRSQPAVIQAY